MVLHVNCCNQFSCQSGRPLDLKIGLNQSSSTYLTRIYVRHSFISPVVLVLHADCCNQFLCQLTSGKKRPAPAEINLGLKFRSEIFNRFQWIISRVFSDPSTSSQALLLRDYSLQIGFAFEGYSSLIIQCRSVTFGVINFRGYQADCPVFMSYV